MTSNGANARKAKRRCHALCPKDGADLGGLGPLVAAALVALDVSHSAWPLSKAHAQRTFYTDTLAQGGAPLASILRPWTRADSSRSSKALLASLDSHEHTTCLKSLQARRLIRHLLPAAASRHPNPKRSPFPGSLLPRMETSTIPPSMAILVRPSTPRHDRV